ncbi:MAG: DNA internalization-related competence protein ComEC/Rec2 [Deltaproteobacteria bacterium]|nr:DNA internalization-related competence protein ComEC/Rec2 [Deltaproteobacteria bacterium]
MKKFGKPLKNCIGKLLKSCRPDRPLIPLAVSLLLLVWAVDHFLPHPPPSKIKDYSGGKKSYNAILLSSPQQVRSGYRAEVRLPEDDSRGPKALLTFETLPSLTRGDTISFLARLKGPTSYKNPGGFDYRRSLERKGIFLAGFVAAGDWELTRTAPPSLFTLDPLRSRLKQKLDRGISPTAGSFLKALLLGDTSGLTPELWNDFQSTGTAHIIAISGQHIAIIGALCIALFLFLLKCSSRLILACPVKKIAGLLTLLPITFYILLAGAPPSAVRAGLMFAISVIAYCLKREIDLLSAIAFAAIIITLFDFAAPFTLSFQLSFLAVLSMALLLPPLRGKTPRLLLPVVVTLAATLGTAPLVACRFHSLPVSGLLTNLWAVPYTSFLIPLGGLSLGIASWIPPLEDPLLLLLDKITRLFLSLLHRSADWSFVYELYPKGETTLLLYLGLLFLIGLLYKKWKPALGLLISGILIVIGLNFISNQRDALKVTFIDVGQGDAALVESPDGRTLLIDGGGFLIPGKPVLFDVGREVVVPFLKRSGVKKIDLILLSHPHPDHYGGLQAVVETFPVGEFWWNGEEFPDPSFDKLLGALREKRIESRKVLAPGQSEFGPMKLQILYPKEIRSHESINNNCLVAQLTFGETRFLFAGDIEREAEEEIVKSADLRSTVLKIPHHGSRTSSSVPFIDTVKPEFAVMSLAEGNFFNFPHPGVLEKYENRGVKVFRTDRNGAVTFSSDGHSVSASPFLSMPAP